MKKNEASRLAVSALLVAVMLVTGYFESLLPAGPVPGIKLGLSNVVLVLALYWFGIPTAFALMLLKVLLSGFLFAGVNAMMYSLAGGLLSVALMSAVYRLKDVGLIALSILGAAAHNCGQVGLAMLILETDKLVYYMGVLMFVGIVTGFVTGKLAQIVLKRLPDSALPKRK